MTLTDPQQIIQEQGQLGLLAWNIRWASGIRPHRLYQLPTRGYNTVWNPVGGRCRHCVYERGNCGLVQVQFQSGPHEEDQRRPRSRLRYALAPKDVSVQPLYGRCS